MGTAERRKREREQRRSDIVDAAEEVFFSKGFDESTMDEIAEVSELSKGTLYLYFDSKEDLFDAIAFRGLEILTDLFRRSVARGGTGLAKVRAIGEAYVQFYNEYPDYFNALIHYHGRESECFSEDEPLAILIGALRDGIGDGSLRSDLDPLKTAIVLWAQTTGVLQVSSKWCRAIRDAYGVDTADVIAYYFERTAASLQPR